MSKSKFKGIINEACSLLQYMLIVSLKLNTNLGGIIDMKKCLFTVLMFSMALPLLTLSSFAGDPMDVEGSVICIEVDEEGNMQSKTEFTECSGTLIMITDDKSYALQGTKEDVSAFMGEPAKTRTVNGVLKGHERGWVLASAAAIKDTTPGEDVEVTGTVVCLLPNYADGNVQPFVAAGDCSEKEPHSHVIKTKGGQVYALHGSEDAIVAIQKGDKKSASLKGQVQGSQGAWVLFVN